MSGVGASDALPWKAPPYLTKQAGWHISYLARPHYPVISKIFLKSFDPVPVISILTTSLQIWCMPLQLLKK
jgi:hypothetical protein